MNTMFGSEAGQSEARKRQRPAILLPWMAQPSESSARELGAYDALDPEPVELSPLDPAASDDAEVLSPAWVRSFMAICTTAISRCEPAQRFAEAVVAEKKEHQDTWAYGMEFQLREFLNARAKPNAIDGSQIVCSERGCLIYVEADQRALVKTGILADRGLIGEMRQQPWFTEFDR